MTTPVVATGVFLNIPAHGHINPTLPLVRELVQRGERLIYYAIEQNRREIEATGASFRAYEELSEAARFEFGDTSAQSPSLSEMARVMIEFCELVLPSLLQATRQDRADYIIHDFTCIWGRYAAQLLELPAVATIPQFPVNRKRRPEPYPGMVTDLVRMFLTGIPSLFRFRRIARRLSETYAVDRAGPLDILASHEALNIVFTSRYFQPYVEDFDDSFVFVGPSIAARDDPPDDALEAFLDAGGGPLIYVSLGTVFYRNVPFFDHCVQAFAGTEKRVVMSVGRDTDLSHLGAVPENFVVRHYVPQLKTLKKADAFITHGGMNSVSEGLWHGVPLVVIPQWADQFFVAKRVADLQAGHVLNRRAVTPERLRQVVDLTLADEAAQARAHAIGESFRQAGGFVRAADAILQVTGRTPSPSG